MRENSKDRTKTGNGAIRPLSCDPRCLVSKVISTTKHADTIILTGRSQRGAVRPIASTLAGFRTIVSTKRIARSDAMAGAKLYDTWFQMTVAIMNTATPAVTLSHGFKSRAALM